MDAISTIEEMNRPEPLHLDLRRSLVRCGGRWLVNHPLIIDPDVDPEHAARVNRRYGEKKDRLERALRKGDWNAWVFLHERPHRPGALDQCARRGSVRGSEYWRLVAEVWTDSENICQNRATWVRLWSSAEPSRGSAMSANERDALARLPESFPVYRGTAHRSSVRGLSWSLDRGKAEWFAQRFTRHGVFLASMRARRDDVLAHFVGRDESEIVIVPSQLGRITVECLDEGALAAGA